MSYLFFPCVEALHGLHRLNMFHLDIKLGNFFLCEDTNKKSVIALGDLDEIIWYDSNVAKEHVHSYGLFSTTQTRGLLAFFKRCLARHSFKQRLMVQKKECHS